MRSTRPRDGRQTHDRGRRIDRGELVSPFIVFALPRSRSYWLSRFLSYSQWHCGHDEARHARSLDDVKAWFGQPFTGTVETGAAPFWRLIRNYCPDIRVVTIRRPIDEVVQSLARFGFDAAAVRPIMARLDHKLDQIEHRWPGVLSLDFGNMVSEQTCARVFEHCLGLSHDPAWYSAMAPINLQVDFPALIRYAQAYHPQLDKLAKIAKQASLASMQPTVRTFDGVTIQQESFDTVFRDGEHLFRAHCVAVGEPPDQYLRKNLPIMREMERLDALFFTTARCNGRLFGYLQTVIAPSLESPGEQSSINLLFYTDGTIPGLGLKLQRASVAALKARGVDELFLRAGVRGDGPRLNILYRRMGAEDFGQLYRLDLRD